jgi:hypothetical protein
MGLLIDDPSDGVAPPTGLLGQGFNDPRSSAIMQLASGLLQGNFGAGLGAADRAYQDNVNAQVDRADKMQQIGLRNLQLQQAQQQWALMRPIYERLAGGLGGQQPSTDAATQPGLTSPTAGAGSFSPSYAGTGYSGGSGAAGMRASGGSGGAFISGLTPDQLAMFKLTGHDLTDVYKLATDPVHLEPGLSYNRFTGQITSIPTVAQNGQASQLVPDPTAPGGFRVIAPPGAVETAGAYAGAAKGAENDNTPLPQTFVDRATGRPIGGTVGDYLRRNMPLPQNQGNLPLTPELAAAIRADAQRNAISNPQVNINLPARGIPNAQIGLASTGTMPASASAQDQGAPQLQSAAEAAAATTGATKAAESAQAYKDALDGKVEEEFQLVNRNKQILPLLARYNTGGIAPEERLRIGNAIATSGVLNTLSPDVAKSIGSAIAGGDPAAGKTLENQLASAGILTMLQTLDKEGKPNRAIFQAVQQAQEGLKSGNATLQDVFELQKRLYDIHYNEQQALTKAIKDGTYDPRTWAGDYSAVRNAQLGEAPAPLPSASAAGGNGPAAMDLPKNPTAMNLVRGQTYKLPNGRTATWNGLVFRSN